MTTRKMIMKNKQTIAVLKQCGWIPVWIALALTLGGCMAKNAPRPRFGSYATATPGTTFLDGADLGQHNYANFFFENNGIVYTCHGGHIDIVHLRIAADHVRYHYHRNKQMLMQSDRQFTFKLNVDPSIYYVSLTYPENWKTLPKDEKTAIADEVALELAQHFTFMMKTWHEVLTFFGYKSMGIVPEFPSAFSWEDNYSNLLGVWMGTAAVLDTEREYNSAMTHALNETLQDLGVQSASVARAAAESMRGVWYEGNLMVTMKVRHIGIGLDDGTVSPMLVPGVCDDAEPRAYPTPTLSAVEKYGFKVALEVNPRVFEGRQILRVVCPEGDCKRVALPDDLPILMDYIEQQGKVMGFDIVK